ncbi:MAG: HD-GYP domain-containing protein [Synergistaceae bacterium]|nr:HD-GYP domain-containing protein [Synergistota bacterium]NLM70733.1 HD-GYP domain-containing protein [Synergistaceae bacterium]
MPIEGDDAQLLALMGLGAKSGKKSHYPELKRRLSELERMRTLLDHAGDAIILVTLPEEHLEFCNMAAMNLMAQSGVPGGERLSDCLATAGGRPVSLKELFPKPRNHESRAVLSLNSTNGPRRFEASFQVVLDAGRESGILILRDQEEQISVQELLAHSLTEMEAERIRTISLTTALVEMKDSYTGKNQRGTAKLAAEIGAGLGMPPSKVDELVTASLLHDVGMMGIPSEILSIPGPLRPVDRRLMQEHCTIGGDLLVKEGFPDVISSAVLHHHERMDGSGYPDGLAGDRIPPAARIIGLADSVEAMLNHRPYRPALSRESVLQELEEGRGQLFDPEITDICLSLLREGFSFSDPGD